MFNLAVIMTCSSAVTGCGGGGSTFAADGDSKAAASFALYTVALQKGESYWDTLPHTDIASDLAAVALELKTSGVATETFVSDDAVTATLADGQSIFLVYDDRDITSIDPESQTSKALSYSSGADGSSAGRMRTALNAPAYPTAASTNHEIVFLVNTKSIGFGPKTQEAFASAFSKAGLPSPAYEVDSAAVTIEGILALGTSHPIDYLNVATHGSVSCVSGTGTGTGSCTYRWTSDTTPDLANWRTYFSDIQQRKMGGAGLLKLRTTQDAENYFSNGGQGFYWFSPDFLTAHLKFNPGAVVVNSSCSGLHPSIAASTTATLAAAGVGLYAGWTGPTRDYDADQSDAYFVDRLLGEAFDNGLGALVFKPGKPIINQWTPGQRPFPLTDVIAAMETNLRLPNPGFGHPDTLPGHQTLTQTTVSAPRYFSKLVFTTLNGGGANSNLVVWGFPSIATLTTVEAPTGGTLSVNGNFPARSGRGQIVDASGTHVLTPTSWSTTQIKFALPPTGDGASGLVTVFSDEGVPSNTVPLTEWKGQLLVTVNDSATSMQDKQGNKVDGVGAGSIQTTTSLHFRTDVHPVYTKIDTPPQKQNFVFAGMMGDSLTALTFADLKFRSLDATRLAQWTLAQPASAQTPAYRTPVQPGTFILGPYTGLDQPSSCNSGLPGPQTSGPTNVFCPFGGINVTSALTCTDSDGSLCVAPIYGYTGYYGYPPYVANGSIAQGYDGLLVFTMNPVTYGVTFTSSPAAFAESYLFGDVEKITVNLSATVQPPLYAPSTPASAAQISP